MTVQELIDELEKFDRNLPVALADWQESTSNPCLAWKISGIRTWTRWNLKDSEPIRAVVLGEG
jgi:hypothetical protein